MTQAYRYRKLCTVPLAKHHRVCEKPSRRRCYILFEVNYWCGVDAVKVDG